MFPKISFNKEIFKTDDVLKQRPKATIIYKNLYFLPQFLKHIHALEKSSKIPAISKKFTYLKVIELQ